MTIPNMNDIGSIYIPRPLGAKELNLSDDWRGRWIDEQELPANAPVQYAYALVWMGDKGYVTRQRGDAVWGSVEGSVSGEKPDAFIKRAVKEQAGATIGQMEMIGFFECRATSHNPDFAKDTLSVRPLYLVVAKKVDDLPAGSAYEKRRLPLNEYMRAIRGRYPELADPISDAGQRYAVIRAKGGA